MIYGHQEQLAFLQKISRHGIAHHAFFFVGPQALGKRKIADAFAQAFVKKQRITSSFAYDPDAWRDIILLTPETSTTSASQARKNISVAAMRELRSRLRLCSDSSRRVVIIDDVHLSSRGAQNALLQMLEEPQKNTIFILISSVPTAVLSTIRSRVVQVPFSPVDEKILLEIPRATPEVVAHACGRPGRVIACIADVAEQKNITRARQDLKKLQTMTLAEKFAYADALARDKATAISTLSHWAIHMHRIAHKQRLPQVLLLVEKVLHAQNDLETTNVNSRLRLEQLLLEL